MNTKINWEETFRVSFTFASSTISESLEQALQRSVDPYSLGHLLSTYTKQIPVSCFCLLEIFNIILYFPVDCLFRVKTITLETVNVTNCHVIATDILFLSSNHGSVQFLYLAASHLLFLAAIFEPRGEHY